MTFKIRIEGNDIFESEQIIRADDFRDAHNKANDVIDAFKNVTVEQLRITKISELSPLDN